VKKTILPAFNTFVFFEVMDKSFHQVSVTVCDHIFIDLLCGLVVRVLGYRSGGPGSIPGTTRKKK
jgi:hypothetical protein